MQNEMRDRLIRLIDHADEECKHSKSCKHCAGYEKGSMCMNYHIADYLLKYGVIVPPFKVGDKIYQTDGIRVYESTISEITFTAQKMICVTENIAFDETAIHKSIFLTKEEVEQKLTGGADND